MSQPENTPPPPDFFKAGGLPQLYTIILIIVNLLIITFTAPQKGYGAMQAMFIAPLLNLFCFLIFLIISYNQRKKTGSHFKYVLYFMALAFLLTVGVFLIANYMYVTSSA